MEKNRKFCQSVGRRNREIRQLVAKNTAKFVNWLQEKKKKNEISQSVTGKIFQKAKFSEKW